ncbi:MAG: MBL fold metallo-hydrolase [Clostridia bacterium]|nr:MBL fold metallo-hydrolase [Clostridia bacterium]
MKILSLPIRGYSSNCYLLISGAEAIIIDPSVSVDIIREKLTEENARPVGIILTHAHYDHMLTLEVARETFGCPLYVHSAEADAVGDPVRNVSGSLFGDPHAWKPAEQLLENGSVITLGDETIKVIHTPGHTPGCICLQCGKILVSGDTIFADGYGRYDLPGGDAQVLAQTLYRFADMDQDLVIYPGHGPAEKLGIALYNLGIG